MIDKIFKDDLSISFRALAGRQSGGLGSQGLKLDDSPADFVR